jgi:beta-aspartyl-dipeptidase (metallo-type)
MALTLIQNGEVYAPEPLGRPDVLLCLGNILKVGEIDQKALSRSGLEVEVVDAEGCLITPGFIDPHEHLLGGSGEKGFSTQTPELSPTEIVKAGITTVVGCLGVDTTMKTMAGLLAKCKALKEEGLNSFIWTGGYTTPPQTITSSISCDIMFVDEVIGVGEIAIADERSTEPSPQELARIVSEANNAGMMSNKCGRTHFHVGSKENRLELLLGLSKEFNVSPEWFYPTHINRTEELIKQAIELAKQGAFVDIDVVDEDLSKQLKTYFDNQGPADKLTISSDASKTGPHNLYSQIGKCVMEKLHPLPQILKLVTSNSAAALKLPMKGSIKKGNFADILVIEEKSFELMHVFSKGKWLFKDGRLNFTEAFLKDSNRSIAFEGEKQSDSRAGKPASKPYQDNGCFDRRVSQVDSRDHAA